MELQPIRFAIFGINNKEFIYDDEFHNKRAIYVLNEDCKIYDDEFAFLSTNQIAKDREGNPVELVDRDIVEWEYNNGDICRGVIVRYNYGFALKNINKDKEENFTSIEMLDSNIIWIGNELTNPELMEEN